MASKYSVEAVFSAVDKVTAPIGKIEKKLLDFGSRVSKRLDAIAKVNDRISSSIKQAAGIATAAGFAAGAAVTDIVQVGASFEKTMVSAAAKFDPAMKRGTAGFAALEAAAEKAGAETEFNAQQAAGALKDLASAGLSAEQAITALPGVVDLATAAEVDLTAASEMATKSLGAFNLKVEDATQLGKNLSRVNNVLAEAAGKTSASMEGLFESIKEGAPIATTAGASLETFIAMASRMAEAGIEGSVAGTTLKNVFLSLAAPSEKAANQLAALHIKAKDKNGNLRDMVDLFAELEEKTKGMGTGKKAAVLEAIFGKIPIAGVSALLDGGTEKIRKLREQLEEASRQDAIGKMASTMRDTVGGDIDELSSTVDGLKISIFQMERGAIRDVLKSTTAWVRANKGLILQRVDETVKKIAENLPDIVKWGTRIAKGVAGFYAFSFGIKAIGLAVEGYNLAVKGSALALKGWRTGLLGVRWLIGKFAGETMAAGTQLDLFGESAKATGGKLAGMRTALNENALAKSINNTTSLLGKAGLLGAAALVGYEFGSWLNDTYKISDAIVDLIANVNGLNDATGKRAKAPGLQQGEDQVLGDGTVVTASGGLVKIGADSKFKNGDAQGPTARAIAAAERNSFLREEEGFKKMRMTPLMRKSFLAAQARHHGDGPQAVSTTNAQLRSLQETVTTTTQKSEVTIKDETGRAEVTKKPKAKGAMGLKVQKSGAF